MIEADYRRAGSIGAAPGVRLGSGPAPGTRVGVTGDGELRSVCASVRGSPCTRPPRSPARRPSRHQPAGVFLERQPQARRQPPGAAGHRARRRRPSTDARCSRDWLTLVVGDHRDANAAAGRRRGRGGPHDAHAPRHAVQRRRRHGARRRARGGDRRRASPPARTLTTIGAFGIIAGILLLVNVLLMLAEERLAELGTMRAVGMSRGPLIGSFTLEGASYGVVGAFVGGGVGVLLGRLLVQPRARRRHRQSHRHLPRVAPVLLGQRPTVAVGIAAGFLIADAGRHRHQLPRQPARRHPVTARAARPVRQPPPRRHPAARLARLRARSLLGDGAFAGSSILLIFGVTIACSCAGALAARRLWMAGGEPSSAASRSRSSACSSR